MVLKIFFTKLFLFILVASAYAQNYPFPQNVNYPNGIRATVATGNQVQSAYDTWYNDFYEEQGDLARVRFDNASETVSEGIGYGMLIMVFMDNAQNNTQPKFDRLWNYYKEFSNSNGVMHWQVQGFSHVIGNNGATDAEVDAALALIMADRQWGGYADEARTLINAIWQHEVNHNNGLLKPGDAWESAYNVSYFSAVAIELFKEYASNTHNWDLVMDANYSLLESNSHGTTGLVSDWCDASGNPVNTNHTHDGTNMNYDGVRTPWRMAWAYAWFGDTRARASADRMANWVKAATNNEPSSIGDAYSRDGNRVSNFNNATFTGAFAAAGMVDASHQDWVNAAYNRTRSFGSGQSYFNATLQVLYMLTLSGNMPMMTGTSSSSSSSSSSSVGNEYVIDDCEHGEFSSLWGGEWYTYSDVEEGGATTITPVTTDDIKFSMSSPGHNSNYAAKMDFTLNQGGFDYDPFAGLGVNMRADEAPHSMTGLTSIRYTYRGAAHDFRIETDNVTDFGYYQISVTSSDAWRTVTIDVLDFGQPSWVDENPVDLDLSVVNALSWQVEDETGTSGSLEIDNVISIGAEGPTGVSSSSSSSESSSSSSESSSSSSESSSSSSESSSSSSESSSSSSESSSSSSESSSSSSSSVSNTYLIDDFEDNNNISEWGGEWSTYSDNSDGGHTVVSPSEDDFTISSVGYNSNYAAKMDFSLNQGDFAHNPFAGIILNIKEDESAHDMSGLTEISYTYRGSAHNFRIETANVEDHAYYQVALPEVSQWTTVTINVSDFEQPSDWGVDVDFDLTQVLALSWQVQGTSGTSGSLEIDDLYSVGAQSTGWEPPTTSIESLPKPYSVDGYSLVVAPTPFLDKAKIIYSSAEFGEIEFRVFDVRQNVIMVKKTDTSNGEKEFDMSKLRQGIYFISMRVNGVEKALFMTLKIN